LGRGGNTQDRCQATGQQCGEDLHIDLD
jgi:hypothetical protein